MKSSKKSQSFPTGITLILISNVFSAASILQSSFKFPGYQFGPILLNGKEGFLAQMITLGVIILISYGILKRMELIRRFAILCNLFLTILLIANVVSFFMNQPMYDTLTGKIFPSEVPSSAIHLITTGTLIFGAISGLIINTLILVYLSKNKSYFVN